MNRKKVINHLIHSVETDLDLAPLLSIMVKLIPVLLLSSAFVQINIIETDLPTPIKSQTENIKNQPKPEIALRISKNTGYEIIITHVNKSLEKITVPLLSEKKLDFKTLNQEFVKIKNQFPNIFEIEIIPESNISYEEVIRTIDMARKPIKNKILFKYLNEVSNQLEETEFMFPNVTFSNVIEG